MTQEQQQAAGNVLGALRMAGLPVMLLPILLAQAAFETNYFQSNVFKTDNNASGIKYINKSYQHATPGLQSPEKNLYAHYANLTDWAKDFKRILTLNLHGGGRPIDATTMEDYVHRLKLNGYFGSSEAQYLAGIKRVMLAMQLLQDAAYERQGTALAPYQSLDPIIPASLQNVIAPFAKLSMPAKIALGVAAFLLLRKLL